VGQRGYGRGFKKYVEKKWKDALNIAAVESQGWEASEGKVDKEHKEKLAWGRR
jgi:hypothetical protein